MGWKLTLSAAPRLSLELHYFQEWCIPFELMMDCFLLFPLSPTKCSNSLFFFFFSNSLLMRLQTEFPLLVLQV